MYDGILSGTRNLTSVQVRIVLTGPTRGPVQDVRGSNLGQQMSIRIELWLTSCLLVFMGV